MTHATPLMVHYKFQNLRTISAEQAHNKDTNLNARKGDHPKEPNIHC
jgi:hypothetical protein